MSKLDQMLSEILSKLQAAHAEIEEPKFPLFIRKQTSKGQTVILFLNQEAFDKNVAHVLVDTLTNGDFGDMVHTKGNPLSDPNWEQISEAEALSNVSKDTMLDFLENLRNRPSEDTQTEDPEIDWDSPDPKYTVAFNHQTGDYEVGKATHHQTVGAEYTTNLDIAKAGAKALNSLRNTPH